MMIENGQDLGISIRGGAEHGLGIYISAVERGSVAEAYGVTVRNCQFQFCHITFESTCILKLILFCRLVTRFLK